MKDDFYFARIVRSIPQTKTEVFYGGGGNASRA